MEQEKGPGIKKKRKINRDLATGALEKRNYKLTTQRLLLQLFLSVISAN